MLVIWKEYLEKKKKVEVDDFEMKYFKPNMRLKKNASTFLIFPFPSSYHEESQEFGIPTMELKAEFSYIHLVLSKTSK